jgi:hypothetical protein
MAAHGRPSQRPEVSSGSGAPAFGGGRAGLGEMQWRMRQLMVQLVWGGRGRGCELHGEPSLAALMEGGGVLGAREQVRGGLL